MLTNAIKQSEAYKAFIDYSISLVLPKKTRGKVSKGKQQEVTTKKKTVITIDDNIITDDLDVAFELGNSISKTDAEIADETRHVHDTHARVVTEKAASGEESKESNGELAHRVTGIQVMTVEEQFAADTKKAMKASKKANREATRTLQQSGGSTEGAEESDKSDENVDDIPWVSTSDEVEKGDEDDDRSIDIEENDDKRTDSDNGDLAMTDIEKNVAKKTEEQGDEEQAEEAQDDDEDQDQKDQADDDIIGTLFLNLSSDASLVGTNKETADVKINFLLDVQIQQEIPSVLSASLLDVLVSVISPLTTTITPPLTTLLTTTPIPTPPIITDEEHKQKDIVFKMMMSSNSYERHPAHKALYDALLESIFMDENDMDRLDVDPAS
ncbi:hypothetical protein Tco_0856616 [Tanacetum coccineum]|uniref:Uncharacterized protein n=1 Tax=Tanacetum coccineum TaxID=301880 RepID=A0ABQ5B5P2_9ASTR